MYRLFKGRHELRRGAKKCIANCHGQDLVSLISSFCQINRLRSDK